MLLPDIATGQSNDRNWNWKLEKLPMLLELQLKTKMELNWKIKKMLFTKHWHEHNFDQVWPSILSCQAEIVNKN